MTTPDDPFPTKSHRPRRRVRRRRRRALFGAGAGLILLGAAGAYWFTYDSTTTPAAKRAPITTTTTGAPVAAVAVAATTKVPELVAYAGPEAAGEPVTKLSAVTEYGLPRTVLVLEQQPGWLKTLLPIRPNGATGWVRDSDVTLSTTTLRIEISLTNKYLVLMDGNQKVIESVVAIGTDETPTPPGLYYVTDPVDLTTRPDGAYGAYALGMSGYSEVLLEFQGGPGQLAVHGTANPDDLGKKISNGCIRVPNDKMLEIAKLVPLGTPIVVTA
jgi:lipoprotein-anchoring transpeptidase ErfK/SrfK